MAEELPLLICLQTKVKLMMQVRLAPGRVGVIVNFCQVVKQNLMWSTDDKLRPLNLV